MRGGIHYQNILQILTNWFKIEEPICSGRHLIMNPDCSIQTEADKFGIKWLKLSTWRAHSDSRAPTWLADLGRSNNSTRSTFMPEVLLHKPESAVQSAGSAPEQVEDLGYDSSLLFSNRVILFWCVHLCDTCKYLCVKCFEKILIRVTLWDNLCHRVDSPLCC